jgi:hypothetical protein
MQNMVQFIYSPDHDIYDGEPWTLTDIEDLQPAVAHGDTIQQVAEFLCRAGSVDDITAKVRDWA